MQRATGPRRPLGNVTRGTTNPNRLRRMDRWIVHRIGMPLRADPEPLVVDLGFGASPVTTLELADRLNRVAGHPVEVRGLEIDPRRVAEALPMAGESASFHVGGFEIPSARRPLLIRAANVLRQYDEADVADAWATMAGRLAPGGVLVEGTCDELGRLGAWVAIPAAPAPQTSGSDGSAGYAGSAGNPGARRARKAVARTPPDLGVVPETLTLSIDLRRLTRPSDVAARLPKALIHRHVSGSPIHDLLRALDEAWDRAAPQSSFGPRQRWVAAVESLRAQGYPVRDRPTRWRLGELTVPWSVVE